MSNKVKFIINSSVEFFEKKNSVSAVDQNPVVEFLENEDLTVIAAVHDKSNDKIQFHYHIPIDEVCLLFYKVAQASETENQQQPLGILTLERNIYSPKLRSLLENLRANLKSGLDFSQSGVLSLKDEIQYWKQKFGHKARSRIDREMAQIFNEVLENIDRQMSSIDDINHTSVEDFLDNAHNSLDELWRLPYNFPQSHMTDILNIIGNHLLKCCIEQLRSGDIWSLNSYRVNNLISHCSDTIDSWLQLCDSLTRLFWPNYVQHSWIGEPHSNKRLQLFKERLTEIHNIRNLHKQITILLDEEEMRILFSASSPFGSDVDIFDTTITGQAKWTKILQKFEQLLQPIDERIAAVLKSKLHIHLSNARQIICILSEYENLIQRPTIFELLTIERGQFLQSLQILLRDLRKEMAETTIAQDMLHISVICNECRWLKVIHYQIQEVKKVSHLISDCKGYEAIKKEVQEIGEETESLLRTNFEIWCVQNSAVVRSGELKLHEDQPVVKFDKEGHQLMRVTFSPKLLSFCQDVCEFEGLGYNVPLDLHSAANHASKFISYARRLQQIATFHNTIGDRMIPCQRPIMLQNAVELSKLVQGETVAWNDKEAVKRYVNILQSAITKLSADNTLLVGYHEQANKTVLKLMNIDLVLQSQVWKDEMRRLRALVASLERQNFTNLDALKLHWDHQLYKVLEYQYLHGLVDMNNKLLDIHVDIVFRQRQLRFRPPEEELREKYFTQLRRFIERPAGFRGLSEKSSDLFSSIVENNRNYFEPLYEKAEELFDKLEYFRKLWMPWVSLGCVDVEELCGVHISSGLDWDRNFKACKNFSQKIAKLQNSEESIDCFVINILPLRSDIEFISRRYWETLSNSLRNSILNDISTIQEFLQSSLIFSNNVTVDGDAIRESCAKYEKIMNVFPKMSEILSSVREKDTCLAGWCKEHVFALDDILMQWEKLQPVIKNHTNKLQHQVNLMKDQLQSKIHNLRNEAENFVLRWESMIDELEVNDSTTLELFKERKENWSQIQSKKSRLIEECARYNMEFPSDNMQYFADIDCRIQSQSKQWEMYDKYLTELDGISAEDWAIYRKRPYVLSEFISKWECQVQSSIDLCSKRIRQNIEGLQRVLPVLRQLQSDALNERHWTKIFMLLHKADTKPFHKITLTDILEDKTALQHAATEIANIVKIAAVEQIIRQALVELDQWSVTANFKLVTHTDSSNNTVALIKDYQDVLNKIGDNQSLLQSAKNSSAIEPFYDQAELWERRLNTLDTLLVSLSQAQRRWIYLEPIFGAGALKSEEAMFKRIDKDFRHVMREIEADPRVISLIKINNISVIIKSIEFQLMRCQNSLVSYIAEKRNLFPRFYFLSDDDLLEILGQAAKDVEVMLKHIRKLFPGCFSLKIEQSGNFERPLNTIIAVQSAEGDTLSLKHPVVMKGAVEVWLNNLVISTQLTLQDEIVECYKSQEYCFIEASLKKYPIQVLSTTRSISFTKQVEQSIVAMSLPKLLKSLNDEIARYTTLKTEITDSLLQLKLRSLLFDMVHFVAIVKLLIDNNVMHISDWNWLQQLKFYLGGKDNRQVVIRIVYAEFEYSYEFLGNPQKLVSTSLTQKCYLVLTQAMHMGLGGNPFGPAGTGKTECVKALGALLGRLVLVFNCDENLDTESMRLILTGLIRCGAWGCFDEFNRLQEATLSVISMLIQPIQTALKDRKEVVTIADTSITLNHHCAIFVTFNPANAEYGGRQKLPGSLQSLFRPIVMQEPQPLEIARVMLFVDGFQHASEIGDRMVELFELSAKMLSKQRHYDWGLRELKSILLGCGTQLRDHILINTTQTADDNELTTELSLVLQCLRNSTMSKLNLCDVPRFEMLLRTIFPEVDNVVQQKSVLQEALANSFLPLGFCVNEPQIDKALQLHEQLTKRMGVIVVGPPGCGKSGIITLLQRALVSLCSVGSTVRCHYISPKSMQRDQLLGRLDCDTRQWMDGVLTRTAAMVNDENPQLHSWIICDGSIDPEWIEALNSVLDDNKILTLPSGWRIQFGNNVNFIFETDDVSHASPATISRMGIVNMSYEDFPQIQIMNSVLSENELGNLNIQDLLLQVVDWIEENTYTRVQSRRCILRSFLLHKPSIQCKEQLCIILFRSLCGFVVVQRHNDFANFIMSRANVYIANTNFTELSYFDHVKGTIENFKSVDHYEHGNVASDEVLLVQTAFVKSYLAILETFLESALCTPFLIVGPSGAAKTMLLQQAVSKKSGYDLVIVNCSNQLTPAYIAHCLKKNCLTVSSTRGREYKPKQLRIVLYFKNLDLCYLDAWGASQVVEFLLQIVQRAGFYADNLDWITVSGLQICGSIATDVALNKIAARYLAMNYFLRVGYPKDTDMLTILKIRLEPEISRFQNAPYVEYVVETIMAFFTKMQEAFTPKIQGYVHYVFSPNILMKLADNLKCYPDDAFNEALICELCSNFKDRLISSEDAQQFDVILKQTMHKLCGREKIYFVPKNSTHSSVLQSCDHDTWRDRVEEQIIVCNNEIVIINEPITKELLDYTAKIARILMRNETNLFILGQPDDRHLDAVYIAATMHEVTIYTPKPNANYSVSEFNSDLKLAMQTAALENKCTCLLIEQKWITFLPEIMNAIEAILEGCEIIDLFGDDLESVASSLKHAAELEGYQETVSSYFFKRIRRNLHLILLIDSTSQKINEYFCKYPALYRNMEFLCTKPMSSETINSLPTKLIEMLDGDINAKEHVPVPKLSIPALEEFITLQAPQRFHQFIKTYYVIYRSFSQHIMQRLKKLQLGVEKLAATYSVVDSLKSKAMQQEDALAEKRKLASEALEMITATMRNANEQKSNMLELKNKAQINNEKLKERQKTIQKELSEVEPILLEASAAVGKIKSEALYEIRSLRAPPEPIRDILEGVLRLMGIRDTSWNSMKTFLSKRGVKEDIRSLDLSKIIPENCEAVEKLLKVKVDSFEMRNAKRASSAAAPLAAWVKASVRYSKVIQGVKPLEREQNMLQQSLDTAEGELQSLMSGLDDVDNRVKQLSAKLNAYTQEAAMLEIKLEEARNTLNSAELLVDKLSSEFKTWNMQLQENKHDHNVLDTKSFIISLVINYFSDMLLEKRNALIDRVSLNLQQQISFELRNSLLTEQEQIIWESMGLARDAQVIENAALVRKILDLPFWTHPIPLILDPTETGIIWLTEYLSSKGRTFEVTSQNNDRLTYSLELAVRFGKILVINDCQDLRAPLIQIVGGQVFVKFNKKQLQIGSKLVDLHEEFQLVLITKTNRLTIGPETLTHMTCIPFTITTVGLTDQLLSKAILMKNPKLEQKRIHLLKQTGELLRQRMELENKLLEQLATAQGDILKNENLLNTLNEVKESSSLIDKSLIESKMVKETFIAECTQLKEFCFMAAQFYMEVSSSYDIAVSSYIHICLHSLERSEVQGSNSVLLIYSELVRSSFQYLARSTMRDNHLTLALIVCRSAYPDRIKLQEWELFVTNFMSCANGSASNIIGCQTNFPDCISKGAETKLQTLLTEAPELKEQLHLHNEVMWRNFVAYQDQAFPGEIRLSFHRVLIAQIFRPDLVSTQLRKTATEILGISPDAIVQPTIEQLVDDVTTDKAILVITKTENDPATDIKNVAMNRNGAEGYIECSIGRGMERQVLQSIKHAAANGQWVCLRNVHLVSSWLVDLNRELEVMTKVKGFRLWLLCESTQGFSNAVMSNFVMVFYEFPLGIKNKIRRMTHNFVATNKVLKLKDPKLLKLYIVLFITNAVLQERRKFIPQGWSTYYDFGEADLKAAEEILEWFGMTASVKYDWNIVRNLCENVAYGGRISNWKDLLVLQFYLKEFFNDQVLNNWWTPLNMKVVVPTTTNMQDYLAAFDKFPDVDEPHIFKLSKYSNENREINLLKTIINELKSSHNKNERIQFIEPDVPKNQRVRNQIETILTLWRKLTEKSTVMQTATGMSESATQTNPWESFVVLELKIGASCFHEVHSTLSQIHTWFKELPRTARQLTTIDQQIWRTLADNQVPQKWQNQWDGPHTAVEYIKGLVMRANAAEERYHRQSTREFIDQINLTTIFNCKTFFSALKLVIAAKSNKSAKNLCLASTVCSTRQGLNKREAGSVLLHPLKIDGAIFVYGKLVTTTSNISPDQQNISPEFNITFVEKRNEPSSSQHPIESFSLPVYSNLSRQQVICHLNVPTSEAPDMVLLSGAALIVPHY